MADKLKQELINEHPEEQKRILCQDMTIFLHIKKLQSNDEC